MVCDTVNRRMWSESLRVWPYECKYIQLSQINTVTFIVNKRQLWLPEFYCKNMVATYLLPQLNTVISLTDIMLICQPIEALKSVLYLCNTLTGTMVVMRVTWWTKAHHKQLLNNNMFRKCTVSCTQTLNTIMVTHRKLK